MPHTIRNKRSLLGRIRRIKGQAEALERALDGEAECSAVLQQIAAIRGATDGLLAEVLEGHLREHLAAPASAKQRQKDLEAVLGVLRSYLK
jgi:DNA-binding FrmR family transcriptional regulator